MPILVLGEKKYPYKISEWTNKDGMAMQSATGMTWGDWVDSLNGNSGDLLTATGLVWMVRRKNGEPDLKFSDTEFSFADFDIELDEEQLAAIARLEEEQAAKEPEADPTPAASPPSARRARASRGSGTSGS